MINEYRRIEKAYIAIFSTQDENVHHTTYRDEKLPDMYAYNCTLANEELTDSAIEAFVSSQLEIAKLEKREHLRVIFHPAQRLSSAVEGRFLQLGFEVQNSLYMRLRNGINVIQGNNDCYVRKSSSGNELEAVEALDEATSIAAGMPPEFSRRKAARKREVYASEDNPLSSYLCYHNNEAVGKCELFIKGPYAKIEDFDVLPSHQRRGFGTALLGRLISDAREAKCEHIFLIATEGDTPQEMYKKLGFEIIGCQSEVTWLKG